MGNNFKSNYDEETMKKTSQSEETKMVGVTSDFEFTANEDQIHVNQQNKVLHAATELQEAKEKAGQSTKRIPLSTKRDKIYMVNLGDIHIPEGNMLQTIETIIAFAKIPGMLIGIGGDTLNNAIRNSVSDSHGEVLDTQFAIESFTTALLARAADEGVDLKEKIAYIRSGNHDNRTKNVAAIDPAWVFAKSLNLTSRYVKNIVRMEITFLNQDNTFKSKFVVEGSHGSKDPSKPGKQADTALNTKIDRGADLVIKEHNHQKMNATETKSFFVPNQPEPFEKKVSYWNTGAHIHGGEYADYASYSFPASYDGEIAALSVLNGQKHIDFINMQSLFAKTENENIAMFEKQIKKLENKTFYKRSDIKKEYLKLSTKLTKQVLKTVTTEKEVKEAFLKKSHLSENLYVALLSGFMVGEDASQITKAEIKAREEEIKKHIDILSKLNGSCKVVLNGNMVFYKKAFTLVNKNGSMLGEKFPEESFAYMELLAKTLYPIRDKIVAWNSGEQEDKIMKYQSEALAKMAMTRLQMPEALCYEPYDKTRLEAEQLKIQAKQVETHNKSVLEKAIDSAMKNVDEAIKDAIPYFVPNYDELTPEEQEAATKATLKKYHELPIGVEFNEKGKSVKNLEKNLKLDYLKDILATKLRAEGEFLSLTDDIDYINYKFPLEEVELREPNKNLIPNILCAMLEIDPRKIAINSNPKDTAYFSAKVKDERGKTRTVSFKGGFLSSGAGRAGVENNLRKGQAGAPGVHVYFTNSKVGKEFVIIDKQTYTNPMTGDFVIKDAILISGGSYSKANGADTSPVNKIYKIYVRSNPTKQDPNATGIYENADDNMKVICEGWNYDTVLSNNNILFEYLKNSIVRSYMKTVNELEKREEQARKDADLLLFNKALDTVAKKETPQAKKVVDRQEER